MYAEELYLSPLTGNTKIDLAGIMELALQLMPIQEAEFLDAAREFLNQGKSEVEDWDFVLESVSLIHHQ
jgi:hypothetical protein